MIVNDLSDLSPAPARAVVINVATDTLAAVAIASVNATSDLPVLLLNCDPTTTSRAFFNGLSAHQAFDVMEVPLRLHGDTLDWLFSDSRDDALLLLDSDAEILDADWLRRQLALLSYESVFGAGFVLPAKWLDPFVDAPPRSTVLAENMYIPCVALKVEPVRRALASGLSFNYQVHCTDVFFSQRLSALLALRLQSETSPSSRVIARLPRSLRERIRHAPLRGLRWARAHYMSRRPSQVVYDTGALIYQYLCNEQEDRVYFGGTHFACFQGEVFHLGGATRASMGDEANMAKSAASIEAATTTKLTEKYQVPADLLCEV